MMIEYLYLELTSFLDLFAKFYLNLKFSQIEFEVRKDRYRYL